MIPDHKILSCASDNRDSIESTVEIVDDMNQPVPFSVVPVTESNTCQSKVKCNKQQDQVRKRGKPIFNVSRSNHKSQESEVLSIIRYRGTSKIAVFFYSFPAIFEVPLYLIIDRTSDSCA